MKASSVLKVIGWIVFGLAAATGLALALGFPVMWLWNWLLPALFNVPTITFWQAVGLLILCHLLFKGQVHGHHGRHGRHGKDSDGKPWARFAARVHGSVGGCCEERSEAPGPAAE